SRCRMWDVRRNPLQLAYASVSLRLPTRPVTAFGSAHQSALTLKEVSARPLVAIVGPTGSGKSDLSLRLCEQFGGEVVNCDSLQIYRHFDIGTAKLSEAERRGIPHHMLDIVNPDEIFTAGEFAARARPLLARITGIKLPVVVGGTGFYLRALLDGLFPAPVRDQALRE